MKFNNLHQRSVGLLFALLLIGFISMLTENAYSQIRPAIPILSLTGASDGWNEDWYPDGRIWIPPSKGNEVREFLLPVFVKNQWKTYPQTAFMYQADPIHSFKFSMLYDSSAIKPVDIQTFHPVNDPLDPRFRFKPDPLAKDFIIDWEIFTNHTYREFVNPSTPLQDKLKGREIVISGMSSNALPNSDDFEVMLYVRFQVIAKEGLVGTARKTLIYLKSNVIMFNDLNVATTAPFKNLRPYNPNVEFDYPDPTPFNHLTGLGGFTGMAGIYNRPPDPNNPPPNSQWNVEPTLPGVIYINITDNLPKINVTLERAIGTPSPFSLLQIVPGELWHMTDPITDDEGNIEVPVYSGDRKIKLANSTTRSRIIDLEIESDQPWLLFKMDGNKPPNTISNNWSTKGTIFRVDNSILGTDRDPNGATTTLDPEIFLSIRCDNTQLAALPQKAGTYVGYITLKSSTASISPARLRVTFINFANPAEPELDQVYGEHRGMKIKVKNSRGSQTQTTELIFGTGNRATNGVDTLYGEFAHTTAPSGFYARWFPTDEDVIGDVQYGFGDFSPNDEERYYFSRSRDIRSSYDTTTSIKYLCRYSAGGSDYYPVILEWDSEDFPPNAQLYLRDALNGIKFNINMREATNIGGTRYSYTLNDPMDTTFVIEYTLPKVIQYVDVQGNPIIKRGWNLLSIPVKPLDLNYLKIYPNAVNIPYFFSQNQYQQSEELKAGVGYFIKYSDTVDTRFAGAHIMHISPLYDNEVRVYPGWNTIGALSVPVSIEQIKFEAIPNSTLREPQPRYTKQFGVWSYLTDRGYVEVSEITPGLGYWIKVGRDDEYPGHGYLKIDYGTSRIFANDVPNERESILNDATKITISDKNASSNLYWTSNSSIDLTNFEMPPAPPSELFDVRYSSGRNLENSNTVILLQGVEYPVSINVNDLSKNFRFYDAVTNEFLGEINNNSNNVTIAQAKGNAIKVETTPSSNVFGLNCYPNPVSSNSTLNFVITENSQVTMKLYDALGNEVADLLNEYKTAGEYSINLNASTLSNGKYICKLVAGQNQTIQMITVVK